MSIARFTDNSGICFEVFSGAEISKDCRALHNLADSRFDMRKFAKLANTFFLRLGLIF